MGSQNFKLNASSSRNRKPLIAVLILAVVIGSSLGAFIYIKNRQAETARTEQKTRDEAQTNSAKKNIQKNSGGDETDDINLPDNSSSVTTDEIPTSENIGISIKGAGQKAGAVYAEATITGTQSRGTCVFTYTTDGDKPVVQQAASIDNVCKSEIPEVQFSKLGAWNLKVVFYLNNIKSEDSKNVSID